jgi:hypothetical protein
MFFEIRLGLWTSIGSRTYQAFDLPNFVDWDNTVHFFAVPKGDADICMVYDGTYSGLNDTLFAPNFWFLTSATSAANVTGFRTAMKGRHGIWRDFS